MTFEEFTTNPWVDAAPLVIVALAIVVVAAFLSFCYSFDMKTSGVFVAIVSVVVFAGAVAGGIALNMTGQELKEKNRTIAENNLKQKYDIEAVLWDESNTYPHGTDPKGKITVEDKNNNILKFRYKINKETREPQLLNDPEFTQVQSNDLLLNKTK